MLKEKEEKLLQGHSNNQVVKIGETVHRKLSSNSDYVHKLLLLLEEKKYPYSPRFLGLDDQGREVLTYLNGDIARGNINWTNEQLIQVVKMIKSFHDQTEGTQLAEEMEVVCHNDLAPWNLVIKDSQPLGFIDFDDAAPGYRINDFVYFLWTFLDLGSNIPISIQTKRIRLLFDVYGGLNPENLVDALLETQNKILKKRVALLRNTDTNEEKEFSRRRIESIKAQIKWVEEHRKEIEEELE